MNSTFVVFAYIYYCIFVYSTPEKSQSDFKDSEVYRMCKAADKQGKTNDGFPSDQQASDEERVRELAREPEFIAPASSSRGKGLSFKVLQWLTDTVDDEDKGEDMESRSKLSAPILDTFYILLSEFILSILQGGRST